jgi:hypothetical protein
VSMGTLALPEHKSALQALAPKGAAGFFNYNATKGAQRKAVRFTLLPTFSPPERLGVGPHIFPLILS